MKQASVPSFRIWSIFLLIAGILNGILTVVLSVPLFQDPEAARLLVILSVLVMLASVICEISAGLKGASLASAVQRGQRVRAARSKILSCRRLALSALILCLIELILSCIFGILLWQLLAMIFLGILIPLIFLIVSRASVIH